MPLTPDDPVDPADPREIEYWLSDPTLRANLESLLSSEERNLPIPEKARLIADRIDDEAAALLEDSELRADLEDFVRRAERGELEPGVSHNEARRIVGLPPLPEYD